MSNTSKTNTHITLVIIGIVAVFWAFAKFNTSPQTSGTVSIVNSQTISPIDLSDVPTFSPEYVLHNQTFSSISTFSSVDSIQQYLTQINSPLASYTSGGEPASVVIWNAARGITSTQNGIQPQINPGLLLAFLEKEQSLLSMQYYNTTRDSQHRIRSAMGYACPDNNTCDPKYYGFTVQLNSAAYQLQLNYNQAFSTATEYRVGNTIETLDGYNVNISNEATAAVYRYTPHVYWGNYNLWKILTANGWGVSDATYSYDVIDRKNIN